jgi:hypothetical protein
MFGDAPEEEPVEPPPPVAAQNEEVRTAFSRGAEECLDRVAPDHASFGGDPTSIRLSDGLGNDAFRLLAIVRGGGDAIEEHLLAILGRQRQDGCNCGIGGLGFVNSHHDARKATSLGIEMSNSRPHDEDRDRAGAQERLRRAADEQFFQTPAIVGSHNYRRALQLRR